MGKAYCSFETRVAIKTLHEQGKKLMEIVNALGCTYAVAQRVVAKLRRGQGILASPKSGRPRKTTERQDRKIYRLVRGDPFKAAQVAANEAAVERVSVRTIQRRLADTGLKNYRAAKKPRLSMMHKKTTKILGSPLGHI